MGEYATLKIWRKLKEDNTTYVDLYNLQNDEEQVCNYLKEKGLDQGMLQFKTTYGAVYYTHIPLNMLEELKHQRVCKYDIEMEWLLCFTFSEMVVSGDRDGYFEAETTVENALNRLSSLHPENVKWSSRLDELYIWLSKYAMPEDIIRISSDFIYYSPDGEFNAEYVKNEINEKIKNVRKVLKVPYWTKERNEG